MLASTFMDMVLGVDIHFEMVPMPAPVPTPIPNPFVGMVFEGDAMAVPKGMPVMIGGPPTISIMDAVGALVRSKWVAGYMHDLLSRMNPGRLRNLLSKGVCFLTGHPVDVATGRVLTDKVVSTESRSSAPISGPHSWRSQNG